MKKRVAAPFSTKIQKMTVLGPQFSLKTNFLVDLGIPWGTQKSSPKVGSEWPNTLLEPIWDHFGLQITFFSILAPIMGAPGPHFRSLRASI